MPRKPTMVLLNASSLVDVIGWGVALFLAVSGWIVGYFLTIRAQQKQLHLELINDARLKITDALRMYETWLMRVNSERIRLEWDYDAQTWDQDVDWHRTVQEVGRVFDDTESATRWALVMEEFEILFPETVTCRKQLLERQSQLDQKISELRVAIVAMSRGNSDESDDVFQGLYFAMNKFEEEAKGDLWDQVGILADLRTHLQNKSLSEITGNLVPERTPTDAFVPRLKMDESGQLQIVADRPGDTDAAAQAQDR